MFSHARTIHKKVHLTFANRVYTLIYSIHIRVVYIWNCIFTKKSLINMMPRSFLVSDLCTRTASSLGCCSRTSSVCAAPNNISMTDQHHQLLESRVWSAVDWIRFSSRVEESRFAVRVSRSEVLQKRCVCMYCAFECVYWKKYRCFGVSLMVCVMYNLTV